MATTTNYGWTTPDDTALVKDGAAAIRTLGSSVDTTTKALNPSTTLGDIEYRSSTANTNTRLGIGSTGNVLTVSGGVPTWAAPAAGGAYTELATGSLSGTTLTISSINQTYRNLYLLITGAKASSGRVGMRLNGNTGTVYTRVSINVDETIWRNSTTTSTFNPGGDLNTSTDNRTIIYSIQDYALTSNKYITGAALYGAAGTTNYWWGCYEDATAITSITLLNTDAVSYTAGTYTLYGVK